MVKKYKPISGKLPHFIHGGDYNPDQWLKYPEILKEDIRLMKLAGCNAMTLGVFDWVAIEPEEGVYNFDWLDKIMDSFKNNGIYAIMATPSGARPAWMSQKYPEVLRVDENRLRILHGGRHNHCFTSPVYRQKTYNINKKLAERYADHPALIGWHISNEFGGECHCELCQEAFRRWLKNKYGTLEKLNDAWWTSFWSHRYTDWSQIESPSQRGETCVHGLNLDWKRFVTYQTIDFMKNEIKPLKEANSDIPVTTNLMSTYDGLDYFKFAKELDVVSWDNYPEWHRFDDESIVGRHVSFVHDMYRSMKGGKPFMMMESSPSATNWQPVSKLKRPGMHMLSCMQAVAHGSDTVQYFQWRKSRGSSEKLHGAVVSHYGKEDTRVFRDVSEVGGTLKKLDDIIGTTVKPEVGLIFDWENRWAVNDAQGPRNCGIKYEETVYKQYDYFWGKGIPVDVIDMDCDFSKYKLLIAPMLYMIKPGVADRIKKFVNDGGTFVATYMSGITDENDLCFLGGMPGPIKDVLGIWSEEIDALYDGQCNSVVFEDGNGLGINGSFKAVELCDLIHARGAKVLAVYGSDFYKGMPAVTENAYGNGKAYYIASRNLEDFNDAFYTKIVQNLKIKRVMDVDLPHGVTAQKRSDGEYNYIFVMNFSKDENKIDLKNLKYTDMLSKEEVKCELKLKPYGVKILKEKIK